MREMPKSRRKVRLGAGMRLRNWLLVAAALLFASPAHTETKTICTIVADATSGAVLRRDGDCARRAPPASTFKIPIALMGYDSGFLKDASAPVLPYRDGDPAWNPAWKSPTDPAKWMKESVVWYSQRVTQALGKDRFASYVRAFGYGNRDASGDPGKDNGLDRAWLSSSLAISPDEQIVFLRKLLARELPVNAQAIETTMALLDHGVRGDGWRVYGKTGSAPPRNADGTLNHARPWGWFVGWAVNGERRIVFARLTQDTTRPPGPAGPAARDALLRDVFGGGGP